VIENIMAHPAMQMHQIGVPLYQSRTFLQPARTVVLGHPTVFSVRVSPTVRWRSGLKGAIPESFGTVTIYSSRNQVDWTPMYSSMPDNGYASFSLMFPEAATYYLKAKFTGDGVIEPSERSIERVTVNKVPTSLAISFTPVVVDALKGEYTTITVSLVPSLSGRSVRLYYARSSAGPRIVIGTCLTDVSGRCLKQWFPTASMYPGSYYLVAEWDGDSQYASARVNSAAFNPPKITVIPEFESSSIMMIVAVLVVLTINLRRAWTHTRTDKSSSSSRTT
jgi:hypothetical protein